MTATPSLCDHLKKKGSKFGFWHKRYCRIVDKDLIVLKNENAREVERVIPITADTNIDMRQDDKPPRFIVFSDQDRPICLSSDNRETVLLWVAHLRNLTLEAPHMNMECFDIVSTLGRGFYGKVILVKKKETEEYFAIKTIHKSRLVKSNKVHTIFTERNVLKRAKHPFIVRFAFAFQSDAKVYLGLEYASGGELFHRLQESGTIPIAEVRLYIAELSMAINFLHVLGVVYRDLKPENVLLDALGHVKLTDFGLSKQVDLGGETGTFCGTSEYLAPEIIARKPYGPKIDWWAIGILTFELLFGHTPFYNQNKAKMFQAIRGDKQRFPKRADAATIDFISMLLEKDPEKRSDFSRIRGHAFFGDLDFEAVLRGDVKPIYVPPSGEINGNFDTEFTMENPQDSLATPVPQAKDDFNGFSYAGGSLSSSSDACDIGVADTPTDLKPTAM